jgi:hypothetical protein
MVSAAVSEATPPAANPAAPVSVEPSAPTESPITAAHPPATSNRWFWLALVCGLGWLLTGLAWWRSHSSRGKELPQRERPAAESERQLILALEKACKANDARAARQAFDRWADFRWSDLHPDSRELLLGKAIGLSLSKLNWSLFSGRPQSWDGSDLLQAVRQFVVKDGAAVSDNALGTELATLYR